jgi:hypothetical protein
MDIINGNSFKIWFLCAVLGVAHADVSITYMNGTGGTFPGSLLQQSASFYNFQSPTDNIFYDRAGSVAGRCNIMGYWSAKNTKQILNAKRIKLPASLTAMSVPTPSGMTSRQIIDDNICNDACTLTNGCGFDSCLTPKPDRASREPLGAQGSNIMSYD